MPSRVRPFATSDMKAMRHDRTILTLPVSDPLEAMSVARASAMDVQGVTVSAPLLEPALSLRRAGASASHASLGVGERGEEVLALPVHVGAEFAGQMGGSVRSDSLCQPVTLTSMEARECPILLVGLDEEVLPPVDARKSPSVEGNGSRVFDMEVEPLSGGGVGFVVERPMLRGYSPLLGFFLCEVCLDPVDLLEGVDRRGDELPEVPVGSGGGYALFELIHGVMDISAVRDNGFLPSEGESMGQGHDFPSLRGLMFAEDRSKHSSAVAGNQPPAGSWAPRGVTAAAICRNEDMLLGVLWEVEDGGL